MKMLRPFFGYYGGKWRDTPSHYPAPEFGKIVEPFAGSAGYALRYPENEVLLCDADEIIVGVWEYLINVSPEEIRSIPDVPLHTSVEDLQIPEEARWLVGFWLNRGTSRPRKRPSQWMRDGIRPGSFWGDRVRETIASQVDEIRHWKVKHCSFEDCGTEGKATWFIDPPYQAAGRHYRYGSKGINYDQLAEWCMRRTGLVIVCENEGADWLPFSPLGKVKTTRKNKRSKEVVWIERNQCPGTRDCDERSNDGATQEVTEGA